MSERPALLLAGPTGVGKSAVALALAERLGGEIISVDSMQVYRGMDIGTAKPSPAEQARVHHHLIDIVDLSQSFDAAQFVARARSALQEIRQRQRVPIFCGGTGLYFQAFLRGLGTTPPPDPQMRQQLEQTPLPELLAELQTADPVTLAKIDRHNRRRITRALEVIRLTGKPLSEQQAVWTSNLPGPDEPPGEAPQPLFFGLERTREDLSRRIEQRVDLMFARGLVAETRTLLTQGLTQNQTALQALGYRQVVEHLQGLRSLEETVSLVKQKTRQYAKRQMTWFRHQGQLEWLKIGAEDPQEGVVDTLQSRYAAASPPAGRGSSGM